MKKRSRARGSDAQLQANLELRHRGSIDCVAVLSAFVRLEHLYPGRDQWPKSVIGARVECITCYQRAAAVLEG